VSRFTSKGSSASMKLADCRPSLVRLRDQRDWNWRHWDRPILLDKIVLQ
jgi:hypothetical protein